MKRMVTASLLTLALTLAACGGLGTIEFTGTVDEDGGRVASDDGGVTVDVPPGAVDGPTDVTVEDGSGEDGGFTVGPEDVEFEEPAKVRVASGDEPPKVPVDPDGSPLDVDVTAGADGYVVSADITRPGTYTYSDYRVFVDLQPRFQIVPVGESFDVWANVVYGPVQDPELAAEGLRALEGVGPAGLELGPVHLLARPEVMEGPVADGWVRPITGHFSPTFRCLEPGSHRFGVSFRLENRRRVTWRTAAVRCVGEEELERLVREGLDGGTPEESERTEPPPEGLPSDDVDDTYSPDEMLESWLGADGGKGTAAVAERTGAVHVEPAEIQVEVGQTFQVEAYYADVGRHADGGANAVIAGEAATGDGPVLEAVSGPWDWDVEPYAVVAHTMSFRCLEAGSQQYGVRMIADYGFAGGPSPGPETHLLGTAECVTAGAGEGGGTAVGGGGSQGTGSEPTGSDATPAPEERPSFPSADQGAVWVPGSHTLQGGTAVSVTPAAFVAAPGQTVEIRAMVTPPDMGDGERAVVLVNGVTGPGDVIRVTRGSEPVHTVADPDATVTLAITCLEEGTQSFGLSVYADTARLDQHGRIVRESGGDERTVLLGTALCAEGHGNGIPAGGWLDHYATGEGPAGDVSLGPTLEGPCAGSASIAGFGTIDPSVSGGVYEVPRAGSAQYEGSIDVAGVEERQHNGRVVLHLPPPLPDVPIGTWEGVGTETSKAGEVSWDLNPMWTPAGALLAVSGQHNDTAGTCSAKALVRVTGGMMDGPLGPAALAFTLFALGLFGFAALPKP